MAKLSNYNGSIDLISGLRAMNGKDIPLMEAHDILVDESGKRLDEALESMGQGGSGAYVLEIDATQGESGTITDEQYNAIVANAPNVVARYGIDTEYYYFPLVGSADGTYMFAYNTRSNDSEADQLVSMVLTVLSDKSYTIAVNTSDLGGGSGGGSYVLELSGDSGTLTDEQYNQLVANAPNVIVNFMGYHIPLQFESDEQYTFGFSMLMGMDATVGYYDNAFIAFEILKSDKTYKMSMMVDSTPTKTYVDSLFGSYITDIDTLVGGDS